MARGHVWAMIKTLFIDVGCYATPIVGMLARKGEHWQIGQIGKKNEDESKITYYQIES
jgi:hypothetical protein